MSYFIDPALHKRLIEAAARVSSLRNTIKAARVHIDQGIRIIRARQRANSHQSLKEAQDIMAYIQRVEQVLNRQEMAFDEAARQFDDVSRQVRAQMIGRAQARNSELHTTAKRSNTYSDHRPRLSILCLCAP